MKKLAFLAIILTGMVIVTTISASEPTDRAELWKKVDAAIKKGLPKTAITHLEPIIESAKSEKRYAEAIKAIATKISLEGSVQGNKPEEKITRMRAAIDKAPAPMRPVMEAIQANWYWHYFQQNRWRFQNRTGKMAPEHKRLRRYPTMSFEDIAAMPELVIIDQSES